MKVYLVSLHGEDVEEMDRSDVEDWHEQYFNIFTDKLEALEYAYSEFKKHTELETERSSSLIADFRMKWLKMLFKYEKDSLTGGKFPGWYHNEIKEVSNGEILI